MLRLNGVAKSYGSLQAVHPTNLTVRTGQCVALIGPSGCGKSTLLRLIIGLIQPDQGTVEFEGAVVNGDNLMTVRYRTGYVIQEGGLFPHLTAEQNIALLARQLRWSKQRIDSRIQELAALTHFPIDGLARFPAQLSGGQRQRVALMRALMLDPDLLLLDEPLGALDPMIRADLQRDLKVIFTNLQKTVVLVTHDLAEAAYLGDEIVLLRGGVIVQQGSLQAMMNSPADKFVSDFVNAQRGHISSD